MPSEAFDVLNLVLGRDHSLQSTVRLLKTVTSDKKTQESDKTSRTKTPIFVRGIEMHEGATFMCNYSVKSLQPVGLGSRLPGEKSMKRKREAKWSRWCE